MFRKILQMCEWSKIQLLTLNMMVNERGFSFVSYDSYIQISLITSLWLIQLFKIFSDQFYPQQSRIRPHNPTCNQGDYTVCMHHSI